MTLLDWDKKITFFLYRQGDICPTFEQVLFAIASGLIYFLPILLIYLFVSNQQSRLVSTKIFLAVIIAWQGVSALLGSWLYSNFGFRNRPFADQGITELLFEQPWKAFPSDHAVVISVVSLGFFLYRYPKIAWLFVLGGLASSVARVMIGFHWFGDILAGALIGLGVMLVIYLLDSKVDLVLKPILIFIERRVLWLFHKKR